MIVVLIILSTVSKDEKADEEQISTVGLILTKLPYYVTLLVIIAVVSIPEGLPLTVDMSLSYSMDKMYKDGLLIRKFDAPERMGAIEEIICGKTGTLTEAKLRVQRFYAESKLVKNTRKDTLLNCELSANSLLRVKESILFNCDAFMQMADTTFEAVGSPIETGLLKLLQSCDLPVHFDIKRKNGRVKAAVAFTPEKKLSATAVISPDLSEVVSVYVKGAPEEILRLCSFQLNDQGEQVNIDEEERLNIDSVIGKLAREPLKVIATAYLDINLAEWEENYQNCPEGSEVALEVALQNGGLTLISIFGMKDEIRTQVPSTIKYAKKVGKMEVRMVSGDHLETARATAWKA
jgi:magnesium-transporting ATPase (P-type)